MPRLLFTYLATQILAPLYASLLILISVLFLSRLIPILDIILDYGIEIADFMRLFAYFTPKLLLFALPMASMMGVIIGATRLTNDNETMVLKSSGISIYRMLPPVITIALCTSLVTGYFSVHLIPVGNQAKAQLLFQLAKEKVDRSLHEKTFSEGLGNIVLYTDRKNPQTKKWEGVYVADLRDRQNPITIIAKTGTITTDINRGSLALLLDEGSLHRSRNGVDQTVDFRHYVLHVPVEVPEKNPLAKTGRPNMTQAELLQGAEKLGRETKKGAALLIEFHKRLALPVSFHPHYPGVSPGSPGRAAPEVNRYPPGPAHFHPFLRPVNRRPVIQRIAAVACRPCHVDAQCSLWSVHPVLHPLCGPGNPYGTP